MQRCYTPLIHAAFDHVRNRSGKNGVVLEILVKMSLANEMQPNLLQEIKVSSKAPYGKEQGERDFLLQDAKEFLFAPTAPDFAFHTEQEIAPFWECRFIRPLRLERLILFNRPGYEDRCIPLHIQAYRQDGSLQSLARIDSPFGGAADKSPFVLEFPPGLGSFVGVRLQVDPAKQATWLHLAKLMICVLPWSLTEFL